jgi:hypothetical protein
LTSESSEFETNAAVGPRRSHEAPQWLHQERRREAASLRRACTLVELVCVVAVVGAFIWLVKDADLYVGESAAVWFAPVVIALYGARKTGSIERRLAQVESSIAMVEASGDSATPGLRFGRRSRLSVARFAWIGFVALTVVMATIGYQSSGSPGDDDSEADDAVTSSQRL